MRKAAVVAATAIALAGCGADTGTQRRSAEADAYSQCQRWAQDGWSQGHVYSAMETYIALKHINGTAKEGSVLHACLEGFAAALTNKDMARRPGPTRL
jgi:hypothetical protein